MMSDDFYIGYDDAMPASIARIIRRVIICLAALAVGVPALLVYSQARFGDGRFEYGTLRAFEGVLVERPYPLLDGGDAQWLLVAPFKFGAAGLVEGLGGRRVKLAGTLIERDGMRMIEIRPDSIEASGAVASPRSPIDAGTVAVRGEIVDPKCYLGVMKPATQQVHRDCAVRCLSGGIPPMLVSAGRPADRYLLVRRDGAPLGGSLERLVGRPIALTGRVTTLGELRFLAVEAVD